MSNSSQGESAHLAVRDKRRSPRELIDVRARVSVTNTNGVTTTCHGLGTNLSDRGMAIHLPLELNIGKKLRLVVLLDPMQQQIRCEGTVRNRKGHRYGIEFSELSREHRELILRCSRDRSDH